MAYGIISVGVQVVHLLSEISHGLWWAASNAGLSILRWKRLGQLLAGHVYTCRADTQGSANAAGQGRCMDGLGRACRLDVLPAMAGKL